MRIMLPYKKPAGVTHVDYVNSLIDAGLRQDRERTIEVLAARLIELRNAQRWRYRYWLTDLRRIVATTQ